MLTDLKDMIERSSPTLLSDFLGGVALFVMLIVGLHLPGLI